VNPPVSIGHEAIHKFNTLNTPVGSLKLLSPTDYIKDRLASFFHWNDTQGLEQALMVGKDHSIDVNNLKRWAKAEGFEKKSQPFLTKLKKL